MRTRTIRHLYLIPFNWRPVLAITLFLPALLSGQLPFEPTFNFKSGQASASETLPGRQANGISGIDTLYLEPQLTENLVVTGKIWGFLKYHHPAVDRGVYNWDQELFKLLPHIVELKSAGERDRVLTAWIDALGEVKSGRVKVPKKGEVVPGKPEMRIKGNIKMSPDLKWIENSGFSPALVSRLTRIRNAERGTEHYYIGLEPQVDNVDFKNEDAYAEVKYPDAGYRLLCLYRYWNCVQYYFPYKYLIEDDWNTILKEYIPIFANASNEFEYKLAVLSLITRIGDSHAGIRNGEEILAKYWGTRWPPLKLSFIENKPVVTAYSNKTLGKKTGLEPGDVIERINGKIVEEIIGERLAFVPGSNHAARMRNMIPGLLRTNDSTLQVNYRRGTTTHSAKLLSYPANVAFDERSSNFRDTCFKLLRPEIAYLHGRSVKPDYLPAIMKTALSANGLIIDMRTYPEFSYVYDLCQYLSTKPREFFKASIPYLEFPGMFVMGEVIRISGSYKRSGYDGKLIILVNERTQSAAEFYTMAFQTIPGSIVVGSQTAGADGNVSPLPLPGGILTGFSGAGVYYPDGTETQRVGIVPDIVVKPTIEGVREGRDEVLEKALMLLSNEN